MITVNNKKPYGVLSVEAIFDRAYENDRMF